MKYIFQFFILVFIISFISDLLLNFAAHNKFISSKSGIIASLRSYFDASNPVYCGINAGLTLVFALIFNVIITRILFGITVPTNIKELLKVLVVAFIVGYFTDIIIYKLKVFRNQLDPYYKQAGAGLLGGIAFDFAIVCSYSVSKILKFI